MWSTFPGKKGRGWTCLPGSSPLSFPPLLTLIWTQESLRPCVQMDSHLIVCVRVCHPLGQPFGDKYTELHSKSSSSSSPGLALDYFSLFFFFSIWSSADWKKMIRGMTFSSSLYTYHARHRERQPLEVEWWRLRIDTRPWLVKAMASLWLRNDEPDASPNVGQSLSHVTHRAPDDSISFNGCKLTNSSIIHAPQTSTRNSLSD